MNMFRSKDGDVYEKCARMVQSGSADRSAHLDLALELHKLAEAYSQANGESYSQSVNRVLSQDRTLREAYARYSHHNGSMSIALPVGNPEPDKSNSDERKHHDVSEMVLALAQEHMRQTGTKSLSEATRIVLSKNRQLAKAYAAHVGSRR